MKLFPLNLNLGIQHERVQAAIVAAELRTSGEIRVVISRKTVPAPAEAAQAQFVRMGMTRTKDRNGVLFFLAPASRTFAVVGDEAIHARCGNTFWNELTSAMETEFKRGDFTAGLVLGVERAGELLSLHFPRLVGDRNELPDQIEVI